MRSRRLARRSRRIVKRQSKKLFKKLRSRTRSRKRRSKRSKRSINRPKRSRQRHFGASETEMRLEQLQKRCEEIPKIIPPTMLLKHLTDAKVVNVNESLNDYLSGKGYSGTKQNIITMAVNGVKRTIPDRLTNFIVTKQATKMDIPNLLNGFIKGQLDGIIPPIEPELKIEIHSIILDLLLYPETLMTFLGGTDIKTIVKTIISILIENDFIGTELKKFLELHILGSSVESYRYWQIIDKLLGSADRVKNTSPENDLTSIQTLINPILDHIKKPNYKQALSPLIDTILYNHTHHRDTSKYLKSNFYS